MKSSEDEQIKQCVAEEIHALLTIIHLKKEFSVLRPGKGSMAGGLCRGDAAKVAGARLRRFVFTRPCDGRHLKEHSDG